MPDNTIYKRAMKLEEQRVKDAEAAYMQHLIDALRRRPPTADPPPEQVSPPDGA